MRWFIAIRYFLSHKRQSLVCIAGVTISVTMFIAMTSMMDGFTDKFILETVESSGHITIHDEPRETRTKILEQTYKDPNAVLVIEKTAFVGGTTAWSGGIVWIPVNGKMKQAGLADSPSDAANYLAATVPETENADLREAFLARGPEASGTLSFGEDWKVRPSRELLERLDHLLGSAAVRLSYSPEAQSGSAAAAN